MLRHLCINHAGPHPSASLMMMQRVRQQQHFTNAIANPVAIPWKDNSSGNSPHRHEGHQRCSVFLKASAASDTHVNGNGNHPGGQINLHHHQSVNNVSSNRCIVNQPTQFITSWLPGLKSDCVSDNTNYIRNNHCPSPQPNRRHSSYGFKLEIEVDEAETKV